jgi:hypothetical protein
MRLVLYKHWEQYAIGTLNFFFLLLFLLLLLSLLLFLLS